jgi:hypothetical protein
MYEFLFKPCILRFLKPWTIYMKNKLYDFTIRVYSIFFVSCQKCAFNNLDEETSYKKSLEFSG